MGIISRMRKQKAVYYAANGVDDFGDDTYDEPVEINCRWEDTNEEFIDAAGERRLSNAIVYVDRDMYPGDVLLLGALSSLPSNDENEFNDGAWKIRRFDKLPNLRNTEYLRTAWL